MGKRQNRLDLGERAGCGGYGDEGGVESALTFGGGWKKLRCHWAGKSETPKREGRGRLKERQGDQVPTGGEKEDQALEQEGPFEEENVGGW